MGTLAHLRQRLLAPSDPVPGSRYGYPTHEAVTDALDTDQDHDKLTEEGNIISEWSEFPWRLAVDFGCGKGRYLPLIYRSSNVVDRLIIGVEPDPKRLSSSQRLAKTQIPHESVRFSSQLDAIRDPTAAISIDLFVACQVFGHISHAYFDHLLTLLGQLQKSHSRTLLMIPFTSEISQEHTNEFGDMLHAVDLTKTASDRGFRTPLQKDDFDALADAPRQYWLPVRAFAIAPESLQEGTTISGPAMVPAALLPLASRARTQSRIYAVHKRTADGAPLIGDLAVRFDQ